jgi:rare lipoprotein A (peptidoglycan hydrolase)
MNNRILKIVAAVTLSGAMATGCASTKVTRTTASAPITYKIGQGDAQYASLDYGDRSSRQAMPRSHNPIGGQGRDFDPSRVGRNLYSHQKVGKTYTIMGRSYTPRHDPDYNETGEASWYGPQFHGKPTANGEIFDKNAMTAAHKTLPLNSLVRVTNLDNGRAITVRLNDRGPFIGERMIDLSEAAATVLGYTHDGIANVRVRYLGPANPSAASQVLPRNEPRQAALPQDNLSPAPRPASPYTAPRPASPYSAPRQVAPRDIYEGQPLPQPTAPRLAELPYQDLPPAPRPIVPSLPPVQQYQAPVVPTPTPRYTGPSLPAPISPNSPRRAPEEDLPGGGDITMTIKGPIHIARSTDGYEDPEFIAEPLITQ